VSQAQNAELLVDIARLLKKHGPDAFESLAHQMKGGQLQETLVSVLDSSAQSGRRLGVKAASKRIAKKRPAKAPFLVKLQQDDPQKAAIINEIHRRLVAKTILPSLRDIQLFAESNGLRPVTAKSRNQAVSSLLRDMASEPMERLDKLNSKIKENENRSLGGWAEVILRNRA